MASWAPELPDPNAGDDLAYAEAWENRIPDEPDWQQPHPFDRSDLGPWCEVCRADETHERHQ